MNTKQTISINKLSYLILISAILLAVLPGAMRRASADTTPTSKNGSQTTEGSIDSSFAVQYPDPYGKNDIDGIVLDSLVGASVITRLNSSPKNTAYDSNTSQIDDFQATIGSKGLISCGVSGNLNWTTTSSSFQVIRQCSLTLPQDGYVFISANSSVARQDGEYEAQFEIGIDSTIGDGDIDRWVNVYNDSGDGTDKSIALSVLKPVSAGTHTFYSLGKRYAGAGTILLYDPTLTVIFIPASTSQVLPCGSSGNLDWTTTSSSYQVIRQCSLTLPQDGYVFVSADGSVARQDGEYEAQFEIGIDSTIGDGDIDRWVNVYNDSGDGTDKSIALSVLKPVSAGTHTFYSLGKRYAGAGTILLYDPTLTVIFIPASTSQVLPCGSSGNLNWTTTSSSYQVIRQCSLTLPQDGYVFISADSSVARQDGEYEAQFEIGIDNTNGDGDIDRWVNVYNDSGDGTDDFFALSVLKPVSAGIHTFYSLGRRYTGAGTVLLYDPTLTVIFISGNQILLPLIFK